jgi:hypothetical protein
MKLVIRQIISCLTILFFILSIVGTIIPSNVQASPGAKLYLDPSSIINPAINPGTSLTFLVKVDSILDLYAWQIKLYFKPTLLNWTAASYPTGHVFYGRSFASVQPVQGSDSGGTYMLFFASLQGNVLGFNGNGTLCQIDFKVLDRGVSSLNFSRPLGEDTWLWDSNLNNIQFEAIDGSFDNKPPAPPAAVYVDPPRKVDPTLTSSHNFTIDVRIKNATALRQFGFKLVFNSTLLNVVNATLGPFLPPATIYTIEVNNTQGYVRYQARVDPPDPSLNGNGTLAIITFHVQSLGFCSLTLTETSLINEFGDPIPHSTADGYFNNALLAKIAVDPPEVTDPTRLPPQTIEFNITIAQVEDLYGYEFKLGYDPAILIALQVTIHDVFGEIYYIPNFSVDNTNGIVHVSVAYYEPANPISTVPPLTVVTLKFRIKARGITALDLYDTSLTDRAGSPITHEVEDGLFANVIRDVALINVTRSRTEAYTGWIVYINVTAENQGDLTETFDVKVYYGTNGTIGTITFMDVDPNVTVTKTIAWNTMSVKACQNYTIWAEAIPLPYEIDLADNFFSDGAVKIWLMGDVNHDRKVDGRDVAIAAKAFASYPGHPRWDPTADLNQDNKIDGKDIARIAANFGRTC